MSDEDADKYKNDSNDKKTYDSEQDTKRSPRQHHSQSQEEEPRHQLAPIEIPSRAGLKEDEEASAGSNDSRQSPAHSDDDELRKKRKMNVIYSRRKRAKKKRQFQTLQAQTIELRKENDRLQSETKRLSGLVNQASEIAARYQISTIPSLGENASTGEAMLAQLGRFQGSLGPQNNLSAAVGNASRPRSFSDQFHIPTNNRVMLAGLSAASPGRGLDSSFMSNSLSAGIARGDLSFPFAALPPVANDIQRSHFGSQNYLLANSLSQQLLQQQQQRQQILQQSALDLRLRLSQRNLLEQDLASHRMRNLTNTNTASILAQVPLPGQQYPVSEPSHVRAPIIDQSRLQRALQGQSRPSFVGRFEADSQFRARDVMARDLLLNQTMNQQRFFAAAEAKEDPSQRNDGSDGGREKRPPGM